MDTGADPAGAVPVATDPTAAPDSTIRVQGFSTPESVIHETEADVYLVSNIVGNPGEADGDGFISRVSPEGEVLELRWIDGASDSVTLDAPKGLALDGGTLYVADLACVRSFDRVTGEPWEEICIDGATFLNDIAVDEAGSLWVTDSGLQSGGDGPEGSGAGALYRIAADRTVERVLEGESLGGPNGVAVVSDGVVVVSFRSGEAYRVDLERTRSAVAPPSDRQLDGIVALPDGSFLVSDWGEAAVLRMSSTGELATLVRDVDSPGDIGFDGDRRRVLIPLLSRGELLIVRVP